MNLKKETSRKNILKFCIIVFALASAMLLTGCQTQQVFDSASTMVTKVQETIESVSSTTLTQGSETAIQDTTEYSSSETFIQDEATVLETVEKFSGQLITGNINIFSGLEISVYTKDQRTR